METIGVNPKLAYSIENNMPYCEYCNFQYTKSNVSYDYYKPGDTRQGRFCNNCGKFLGSDITTNLNPTGGQNAKRT